MKTQQQNTIDSIVLMTATQLQTLFDAYQDLMCEMNDSPYDLEDDEIEYAKEILKKCNAIIKVQEILLSNKL